MYEYTVQHEILEYKCWTHFFNWRQLIAFALRIKLRLIRFALYLVYSSYPWKRMLVTKLSSNILSYSIDPSKTDSSRKSVVPLSNLYVRVPIVSNQRSRSLMSFLHDATPLSTRGSLPKSTGSQWQREKPSLKYNKFTTRYRTINA